jgi:hypothetical protein
LLGTLKRLEIQTFTTWKAAGLNLGLGQLRVRALDPACVNHQEEKNRSD